MSLLSPQISFPSYFICPLAEKQPSCLLVLANGGVRAPLGGCSHSKEKERASGMHLYSSAGLTEFKMKEAF